MITDVIVVAHACRTLELVIFFPAEENVFRVKSTEESHHHKADESVNGGHDKPSPECKLLPEPVPPGFTLEKFYWSLSLWWSWRGIGWNYSCPLPNSSHQHPFIKTSTRRQFLSLRIRNTILLWIFWDVFRTITNLTPAALYLTNPNGQAPRYADWSILEKAFCSIMIPARIVIEMEKSHLIMSVICVGIGGYMGWEGEIWSPWGWPPLFGSFVEIFRYPGLATMWSKVCRPHVLVRADRSRGLKLMDLSRHGMGISEDGCMS